MEVDFFFGAERSLKAERNCFNLIVNEREFELSITTGFIGLKMNFKLFCRNLDHSISEGPAI